MNNTNIHKVGVRRKSSVVLSLLLGSAALVLSTLTSSAGATQSTVPFEDTVEVPGFVQLGFGECSEINWPLHLSGFSHVVTQNKVVQGGDQESTIVTEIDGIATDGLGNTFAFLYHNLLRGNFVASVGEETAVFINDMFTMHGEAGHISFGFSGSLIFDEFGNFVRIEVDHSHGNYVCDPI